MQKPEYDLNTLHGRLRYEIEFAERMTYTGTQIIAAFEKIQNGIHIEAFGDDLVEICRPSDDLDGTFVVEAATRSVDIPGPISDTTDELTRLIQRHGRYYRITLVFDRAPVSVRSVGRFHPDRESDALPRPKDVIRRLTAVAALFLAAIAQD